MEEDTLMSRADISGGNGRHKPVGAPPNPHLLLPEDAVYKSFSV